MFRTTLDTNVLVSAYGFGGRPAELWYAVLDGRVRAVTSVPLLTELADKLYSVCGFDDARVRAAIAQIVRVGEVVEPAERIAVIADEADNRVLECAVAGTVDLIVTGDRHLLDLGEYGGIPIARVADALDRIVQGDA